MYKNVCLLLIKLLPQNYLYKLTNLLHGYSNLSGTMRQVITLHLGQAGIQIGQTFWQLLCIQHGINLAGNLQHQQQQQSRPTHTPHVMFDQTIKGKFVSRSYWLDSDPMTISQVKKSAIRQIHNPARYFLQKQQVTSFFTASQMSLNRKQQQVIKVIRKLIQACNNIQAIVITCSVSGGTGSGYLSSILSSISNNFSKVHIISFIIYPSNSYSSSIVEPYNALMAQTQIIHNSTANIMFTNEKMYDSCERLMGVERPNFDNINKIVAHVMSDVTAGQRFYGPQTKTLSHMLTNLVPYWKMNCLTASYAPLVSEYDHHSEMSVNTITRNCFEKYNNLTGYKSMSTKDLCSYLVYRGDVNQLQSQRAIDDVKNSQSLVNLVSWSPTGISVSHCPELPKYFNNDTMNQSKRSCSLLANTAAIRPIFERINKKYQMLYDKRAFVHWYFGYTSNDWFREAKYNFEQMLNDYLEVTDTVSQVQLQDLNAQNQ